MSAGLFKKLHCAMARGLLERIKAFSNGQICQICGDCGRLVVGASGRSKDPEAAST